MEEEEEEIEEVRLECACTEKYLMYHYCKVS